ncbi:hypothetical protein A9P82_10595 [Arachidicoccus ginsenosidimutans]|uniref:hypothetical protein n=1 Tax=Arachidicoccus sp. BS20 TaxID=1850526 RepID=UPI0007F0DC01|nr:hypothetical protein [Arachidicoccus sp. BS20]ANI89698.1 hypothetical protein A9P82_10595 [Arachidicoccus sp. BS20]
MQINKSLPFKDVIIVDNAATIRALDDDENIDRRFELHNFLNRFKIKRSLKNLSYNGTRFPHMLPKQDAARIQRHTKLWDLFNAKAAAMAEGTDELEPVAQWIRNENQDLEPGIFAQQIIGQFFNPAFQATLKTWEAALIFHEDAVTANLLKWLWWQLAAKANRAKKCLAEATGNDIIAMHGIGIAVHNLTASLHKLKELYSTENGKNILPEEAVDLSLSAPPVVLRQSLVEGAIAGCPYSKFTLFLFKLKDANQHNDAKDLIFMSNAWSRCPAEKWIPAVISGIWKRVILPKVN